MRRVNILGVWVHDCDEDEAVRAIESFLRNAATPPTPDTRHPTPARQICTVNPEFVMEARHNRAFRELLNGADLTTPDGIGIVLAARLLGTPVRGRATGVALVERIAEISAREGHRIFFLGAQPGVAEEAAAELLRRYPGANIVGTYSGSPKDEDFPQIRSLLDDARPDVLLVAYGAPAQDLWIRAHRDDLPPGIRVAMGVGGVFDYLAGRVPLAPPVIRRLGLEWLYRLIKQPWRWRRILRVFAFGLLAVRAALVRRFRSRAGPRK